MAAGSIPADWRTRRLLTRFQLDDSLPFLDVDAPATHSYLTEAMAPVLTALGMPNLDVGIVRGPNRFNTRAISTFAYVAKLEDGSAKYSGLRYGSRLGTWECWAIFEGTQIGRNSSNAIAKTESALERVARTFDLTIH